MKKLKLFSQNTVEIDIQEEVKKVGDPEEQVDIFLFFIYRSLPATTFEALAKRLEIGENRLIQICEKAFFKEA